MFHCMNEKEVTFNVKYEIVLNTPVFNGRCHGGMLGGRLARLGISWVWHYLTFRSKTQGGLQDIMDNSLKFQDLVRVESSDL